MTEPITLGRCGDASPTLAGGTPQFCELRAGHAGWHQEGNAEWSSDTAAERAAAVADLRARVLALAFASDDGSEYEHDHGIGDGYPGCPACWAEGIRAAVTDTTGGQQ